MQVERECFAPIVAFLPSFLVIVAGYPCIPKWISPTDLHPQPGCLPHQLSRSTLHPLKLRAGASPAFYGPGGYLCRTLACIA